VKSSLAKISVWSPREISKDTNSRSHVVRFGDFLMPGDSPRKQENLWRLDPDFHSAKILVLGHHGSHTSTSEILLKSLPQVRMAVSSARWARYHHPSPEVITVLRRQHIALLRTEDWGNLWFQL
jgi:competence protein ComEC